MLLLEQIQLISCVALVAVIWTVQLLIYPNFRFVEKSSFQKFHQFHTERITLIVGPLMLVEAFSATYLCLQIQTSFWFLNLLSIGILWALTAFVSVPIHNRLAQRETAEFLEPEIARLIRTNWLRTLLWSIRGATLFLTFKFPF